MGDAQRRGSRLALGCIGDRFAHLARVAARGVGRVGCVGRAGRRGVDTNGGTGGRTDGGDRLLHPHTGRRLPGKAIWKPTPKVNGLLH